MKHNKLGESNNYPNLLSITPVSLTHYCMLVRGYEFYVLVFSSIAHSFAGRASEITSCSGFNVFFITSYKNDAVKRMQKKFYSGDTIVGNLLL